MEWKRVNVLCHAGANLTIALDTGVTCKLPGSIIFHADTLMRDADVDDGAGSERHSGGGGGVMQQTR